MPQLVNRLHITRVNVPNGPNYRLLDGNTGAAVAEVEWLNVDGAPFAFGGSADDVSAEFGGEHRARVALANEATTADGSTRRAAGARITLVTPDEVDA